jgi:hypothetical protein
VQIDRRVWRGQTWRGSDDVVLAGHVVQVGEAGDAAQRFNSVLAEPGFCGGAPPAGSGGLDADLDRPGVHGFEKEC